MKTLKTFMLLVVAACALATALTVPASAERRSVTVRMADGSLQSIVLDVPEGATLQDIRSLVPGEPVSWGPAEQPTPAPAPPTQPSTPPPPPGPAPPPPPAPPQPPAPAPPAQAAPPAARVDPPSKRLKGQPLNRPSKEVRGEPIRKPRKKRPRKQPKARPKVERAPVVKKRSPIRNRDGSPTPSNPGFVQALPGPARATGVPNFVIRKFRVPVFLLPIYQAAGIQYGVRWEVLAAINEIETDYGRNLNVSSAGALGWMQFIPSTWNAYGVDANKDG